MKSWGTPLFLAVAVVTAAPIAAQEGRPYEEAVAARQSGDPARAAALLEPWVAAHPEDLDARLQLGFTRLALGEFDAAEADFRAVLAAAPDYRDAQDGLDRVAQARVSVAGSRSGFVIVEGALADLSGNRQGWREFAVATAVPTDAGTTIDIRGAYYRRFGLDDIELAAGVTRRISRDTWARLGASATLGADFRPKWSVSGGIDQRFGSGGNATVLGVDLRYQEFPLQDVVTIAPQLTRYFARGRMSGTLRATGTLVDGGSIQPGGLGRLDYMPTDRTRIHAGIGYGPDTDLGVAIDTTSLFGGVEFPVSDRISLVGGLSHDSRGDDLDRTEGRLGIKVGF